MKISELITSLEKLKKENGDIDVLTDPPTPTLQRLIEPDVRYMLKKTQDDWNPKMWNWFDGVWNKGRKFIRII